MALTAHPEYRNMTGFGPDSRDEGEASVVKAVEVAVSASHVISARLSSDRMKEEANEV